MATALGESPEALFIKLGEKGRWEEGCLREQTLHIGYNEAPHDLCSRGRWDEVRDRLSIYNSKPGVITHHVNQVRLFYEAGPTVLWVTFFRLRLWWCRATLPVVELSDGSRIRHVDGVWSSVDAKGRELDFTHLSGTLLAVQGYRGTICAIPDPEYLRRKIAGEESPEVLRSREALVGLERQLEVLIRGLHHKDFEILVDLIFRQAGWKRSSVLGETMQDIDLDLVSPVNQERYAVQIKSRANGATLEAFRSRVSGMTGFTKFYLAVHTPGPDLHAAGDGAVEVLLPGRLAELATSYGLATWVIEKAG